MQVEPKYVVRCGSALACVALGAIVVDVVYQFHGSAPVRAVQIWAAAAAWLGAAASIWGHAKSE